MSDLHPTTLALLRHLRSLPCVASPRMDWSYVNAWDAAGFPDCPVEPRFVPTVPDWYWRDVSGKRQPVEVLRGTDGNLWHGAYLVTDDGSWLGPVAPWAPPSAHPGPGPCQARTAEEARANPMPGDRWKCLDDTVYTVLGQFGDSDRWRIRWLVNDRTDSYVREYFRHHADRRRAEERHHFDRHPGFLADLHDRADVVRVGPAYVRECIAEPGETYLGHFPEEVK